MKSLKYMIAGVIFSVSSLAFAGNIVESDTFPNGNVKYTVEKITDENSTYYVYKSYFENGSLKEKGFYNVYGDKTGKWIAYYDNKNVASEIEYVEGMKDGVQISYLEDGTKQIEGEYKLDKKHGVFKQFSEDGSMLTSQRIYTYGKLKESYTWDENEGLLIVKN